MAVSWKIDNEKEITVLPCHNTREISAMGSPVTVPPFVLKLPFLHCPKIQMQYALKKPKSPSYERKL